MTGRAALITGGANKLAVAIAEALAAEGYAIMLNDPTDVQPVLERLRALSAAENHGADPRDGAAMAATVEATVQRFGRIDVLVNAAAQQYVAPIEEVPGEVFDAIVATNLGATFYATQAALPHMRAQGWGRIINQASVHGLVACSRASGRSKSGSSPICRRASCSVGCLRGGKPTRRARSSPW
jgi:3-hydroxybutyrate dehydrogenase